MKPKKILVTLFNFGLAFSLLSFVGAPTMIAVGVAAFVAYQLNQIPAIKNAMFSGFITNGSEFNGKENEDIIIRPMFLGKMPQEMGIRVIPSVKSTVKLTFFGTISKILKAYANGFQGGSGSTIKQKKLTLAEFKAEAEYSKQDYKNTILENITNVGGIKQNDITGTDVLNAEISVFMNGVMDDVRRIFWLGDTDKKTLHTSGYYTSTADVNYNVIDGIWKALMDDAATNPTGEQIKRIALTNNAVAKVDTVTLTGTSGTANITVDGVAYLATFTTSLTTSAANFVTSHSAALALRGITVTSSGADVIFTAAIAGQPHVVSNAVTASGDLAGTSVATTANTAAQALGTDEAINTFKLMYEGSNKVLKSLMGKKMVRLYVTDTMIENYQSTLEALGTEAAHKAIVDGIERLTWRGIPLIPMDIDAYLSADFNEPYPHRAIMTVPDNLCLVVNGASDLAETRFWFNEDENTNRQRTQFEFGADYILPELVTVAY